MSVSQSVVIELGTTRPGDYDVGLLLLTMPDQQRAATLIQVGLGERFLDAQPRAPHGQPA